MGPRRRHYGRLAGLGLVALALAGCYQNPDPTEWGAAAKANFVAGCTTETQAGGGSTTTIKLATENDCECIYDKMVNDFSLSWEDMKEYEKKQAAADPADEPPAMPKPLTQAIEACEVVGPTPG